MTKEIIKGRTPSGGDYTVVMFKDKDGKATDKEHAVSYEIQEYKDDGTLIQTTYA